MIRAADTDVCALTTESLASNATIRTGAAKIDTDTLRAHFGMFDIVGEAQPSLVLGFGETADRVAYTNRVAAIAAIS